MSNSVTNIDDLPLANSSGPPPNISLQTVENKVSDNAAQRLSEQRAHEDAQNAAGRNAPPNPTDYMKQVITDVNKVAPNGGMQLPDRDIPRDDARVIVDETAHVNYVPEGPDDYIKNFDTQQDINMKQEETQNKEDAMEFWYNELQTPLLISVIYFILQVPLVNRIILKNIPGLFKTDGNLNTNGILFNSVLFGSVYYLVSKVIKYIAE